MINPRHREHQVDFDADADQQQESRASQHPPHGEISAM